MKAGHELLELARQLKADGRPAEAAEALERAALHFARTGKVGDAFTAWWDAGRAWLANGDPARADAALVGALPYARSLEEKIALDSALVNMLANSDRAALAIPIASRLAEQLSRADATIDPQKLLQALRSLSQVVYELKDSFATFLRVGNALRPRVQGDPVLSGSVDYVQAQLLNWMCCPQAAEPLLHRADGLLAHGGELLQRPSVHNQLARAAEIRGRVAEEIAHLDRTEALLCEAGAGDRYKFVVRGTRALAQAAAGRLEEAIASFHGTLAVAKAGEPLADLMRVRAAAVVAACGLREEALQWLHAQPHLAQRRLIAVRTLWLMARLTPDAGASRALVAQARADCPEGDFHDQACQQALELRHGVVPVTADAIESAIATAHARGMLGLVRHLSVTGAQHAAAQGELELAAGHAMRAIRLQDCVGVWMDDHASVWEHVGPILARCGLAAQAEAAAIRWKAHTDQWPELAPAARALLAKAQEASR